MSREEGADGVMSNRGDLCIKDAIDASKWVCLHKINARNA